MKDQLKTKEIVVLTGMRRVGKTTLLIKIFDEIESENKVFLDLDNILDQMIFEEIDYNNIWANLRSYNISPEKKAYIFLDEIQVKPDIVKAVKYLYDHYDVKFFITGSSSFYLKNLFPESLAGRKVIFELFPLDFAEFLIFNGVTVSFHRDLSVKAKKKNKVEFEKLKKYYGEYLLFGGFPQVVLAENEIQKRRYLGDIFTSYFEKDVKVMADFRRMSAFRDLLFLLLQRIGSKLDITKLSSEVGVSRETVYSYISFLEATYVLFLISPFTRNVDREISGTKKVYFCDNGLLNQFARVSSGSLLENAVFLNLRKFGTLNYYQRRSGMEIDFILQDKQIALEVKTRGTVSDYNTLSRLSTSLGLKEHYLISQTFGQEEYIIPASDL
ncbi:MAG: ATP-binding protein [Fidelibacterota bacterium]